MGWGKLYRDNKNLKKLMIEQYYIDRFGSKPIVVRAPGRINFIGEHTDYNQGYVFPAAVNQEIQFSLGKSKKPEKCCLLAIDLDEEMEFDLSDIQPTVPNSWQNYILGVVQGIVETGRKLEGFNLVFSGNIPAGAGMSSSAALECGACYGLSELFNLDLSKREIIEISQKAEHHFVGVQCGIMDQFASVMGLRDRAFLLDCNDLTYEYVSLKLDQFAIVLYNSNVTHSLASSEYNVRREQCAEGVHILSKTFSEIKSLRDADMEKIKTVKDQMPEVVYRRCKYVLEENQRVIDFLSAISMGKLDVAGQLLKKAQVGMRDDYEITCPEIDFMTDFANSRVDVAGSRMMGGGFGGCTINLVKTSSEKVFIEELGNAYESRFRKSITPIQVKLADGVSKLA